MTRITRQHGEQDKWWQREVVDEVCLVGITEIRQVLSVGYIGFGDDDGIRIDMLDQQSQQTDYPVRLGQVDTFGTADLPQEGDSIQPEYGYSLIEIQPDDPDDFE